MSKTVPTLAVVLLALGLTSCASTSSVADAAPVETPAAVEQTTPATEAPAPAITAAPAVQADTPEGQFVAENRKRTDIETLQSATDEQLIAAGEQACVELAKNPDIYALRLVEGEEPSAGGTYLASGTIGVFAEQFLCPEVTQ